MRVSGRVMAIRWRLPAQRSESSGLVTAEASAIAHLSSGFDDMTPCRAQAPRRCLLKRSLDLFAISTVIIGGIGLFLMGMILMTDGLKAIAGDALRRLLARFTGQTLSAVGTGAVVTLIVQSSTATTLATIGFVSAGLLPFTNAIGVIIGANVGTTSTGWIVSLLGLKFSIGTVAMPLVGVGAILRLLGRDRIAEVGNVLAGFGLIFVGIDVLQDGMTGLSERIDLSGYGGTGLWSRLLLVVIGVVMTIVMQSSSAAVATTLTAVASGTIGLDQAAALVVGQNIGTTFTAVLASIGASVPARRTALVHVIFNVTVALAVFFVLPRVVDLLQWLVGDQGSGADHALVIAAFHTGYSLLGALIFIPLVPQLARFTTWLLPDRGSELTRHLDPSLRSVPSLAIAAAVTTLRATLAKAFAATAQSLTSEQRVPAAQYEEWRQATEEAGELIERLPATDQRTLARLTATLHLLDHVRQFVRTAGKPSRYQAVDTLPALRERATEIGLRLRDSAAALVTEDAGSSQDWRSSDSEPLGALRTAILDASAGGEIEVDEALVALNAQRWLDRLSHHAHRALHYLRQLDDKEAGADSPPLSS